MKVDIEPDDNGRGICLWEQTSGGEITVKVGGRMVLLTRKPYGEVSDVEARVCLARLWAAKGGVFDGVRTCAKCGETMSARLF